MQISLCSRGTFLCLSLAFGGDIPEKKTEGGSFIVGLTATWVPLCKARSLSAGQSMKLTSLFILRFHSSNPWCASKRWRWISLSAGWHCTLTSNRWLIPNNNYCRKNLGQTIATPSFLQYRTQSLWAFWSADKCPERLWDHRIKYMFSLVDCITP